VTGRRSNQLSYHPFTLLGRAEPRKIHARWQYIFSSKLHFSECP
jgi:hypothetical protein